MPNFSPYPANNAALVTELYPDSCALRTSPPLLDHLVQCSAELCVFPCPTAISVWSHSCLRISFFVPVKVTRLRPRISDDSCRHAHPRPFLSRSSLYAPFPHSYIHLPNTILTSPSPDILHSFSVPNTTFPGRSHGTVTHLFFALRCAPFDFGSPSSDTKLYSLWCSSTLDACRLGHKCN